MKFAHLFLLILLLPACTPAPEEVEEVVVVAEELEVLPGVEVLLRDYGAALQGKRVGILTNPTGVPRDLVSTIDAVRSMILLRSCEDHWPRTTSAT